MAGKSAHSGAARWRRRVPKVLEETKMLKEFREFIARGNVLDMTVGIVVGTAFAAIAKSLAEDVIMPPIGVVLGKVDFGNLFLVIQEGTEPGPYTTLADAQAVGAVTLNYGVFLNVVVSFLIIAFAVFLLVRSVNRLHRKETAPAPVTTRDCPYCLMSVSLQAVRCPHCTSHLEATRAGS